MKIITLAGEQITQPAQLLAPFQTVLALPETADVNAVCAALCAVRTPTTVAVTDGSLLRKQLPKQTRELEDALARAEEENSRYLSVLFVE